jgi:transposase
MSLEAHQAAFTWVLGVLQEEGLLEGKTLGIDATTLEANAAMRSIQRRDTGEGYREFLESLAASSGIETPSAADLRSIDKGRGKGKASNAHWRHPHDPDARIAKMKDGRTHMAYKAEHAVDLQTDAVVAVQVHPADQGDTGTIYGTLTEAAQNLEEVREQSHQEEAEGAEEAPEEQEQQEQAKACKQRAPQSQPRLQEVVTDRGYHSEQVLRDLAELELRAYASEPERGRRRWKGKRAEQEAVYSNRRRIRGRRGGDLLRRRAEYLERSFAHLYETGGMRRLHLRGRENIAKRLLVHAAGRNLSVLMRKILGSGTPRRLRVGAPAGSCGALWSLLPALEADLLGTVTSGPNWSPRARYWATVRSHGLLN